MGKRKKKAEEGHHGGAWKVAYADFVTAMMALFMVLWISSQDEEILISTSDYFQTPFNSPLDKSSGVMPNAGSNVTNLRAADSSVVDMAFLHSLAREFYKMLNLEESRTDDNPIDIKVNSDGLRIIVYDRASRPIFKHNSSELTDWGLFTHKNLAWLMARHENLLVRIDAHTSKVSRNVVGPGYNKWKLTTERCNVSLDTLVRYALDPKKVERLTGFADKKPLKDHLPEDEANQRVEFSLVPATKNTKLPTLL